MINFEFKINDEVLFWLFTIHAPSLMHENFLGTSSLASLLVPQSGIPSHLCRFGVGSFKWCNGIVIFEVLILFQMGEGILRNGIISPSWAYPCLSPCPSISNLPTPKHLPTASFLSFLFLFLLLFFLLPLQAGCSPKLLDMEVFFGSISGFFSPTKLLDKEVSFCLRQVFSLPRSFWTGMFSFSILVPYLVLLCVCMHALRFKEVFLWDITLLCPAGGVRWTGRFYFSVQFFLSCSVQCFFVSLPREVFFFIFLFPRSVCFSPKVCLVFFSHFSVQGGVCMFFSPSQVSFFLSN